MALNPIQAALLRPGSAAKFKSSSNQFSNQASPVSPNVLSSRSVNLYSFIGNSYYFPEENPIEIDPFRLQNPFQPNQNVKPFSEVLQNTYDQFFS